MPMPPRRRPDGVDPRVASGPLLVAQGASVYVPPAPVVALVSRIRKALGLGLGLGLSSGGSGGSSPTSSVRPFTGIGQNTAFNAWYDFLYETVDIAHGLNPTYHGGASDNTAILLTNYDTDWSVQGALPVGADGYQIFLDPTDVSSAHKMTWTNAYDGVLTVVNCTSVGTQHANDITFTPQTLAQAKALGNASRIIIAPGTAGILPRDVKIRPVSDPGTTTTALFKSKMQSLSGSSGPYRPMHRTSVEQGMAPVNYATIKYPVDLDGQLFEPILTATNRNTPRSINWWAFRDGTPIEVLVQMANELNRDLCLPVHWNADSTYYNKVFDIILNGSTVNGVNYPALSSNLNVYLAVGNENWNFAYYTAHQADNEAHYRGQVAPGNKTQCRLCDTVGVTLSGSQTVDSVTTNNGDRVLRAVAGAQTGNGVYVVNTGGAWTRATDADASGEIVFGDMWFITAGSSYANSTFTCRTNTSPIIPGTTAITIDQFARWDRYAEKSCQVFILAEAAFTAAGSRSRLKTVLEWQAGGSSAYWAIMCALPDRAGSTVGTHVNYGSVAPYFGDDGSNPTYSGSTSTLLNTYNSASGYNTDLVIGSWALGHKTALAAITGQGGVPIKIMAYEYGRQDVNNDATFLQNLYIDPVGHDVQCYYYNETRRLLGTDFKAAYHVFTAPVQAGAGGSFGMLHQIDDVIATTPMALATQEAALGNFTMFDATWTQTAGHSNDPIDTVIGTFSKGLLPEATFSLIDPSGYFKVDTALDASGNLSLKVKVANPPVASPGYNVTFQQTYNGVTHNQTVILPIQATFTPTSPSQPLAAYFDISDISTLFKDTAGTVPVTSDGDILKCIKDKSGNLYHVTGQFGASFTYRTGGGKPYAEMDGVTTFASAAGLTLADGSGQFTLGAAVVFTNNTGDQEIFGGYTNNKLRLRNNAGTAECIAYETAGGPTTDAGPAITAGASTRLEARVDTAVETFVNGVSSGGSTAIGGGDPVITTTTLGLGNFNGGGITTGKFYAGLIYKGPLSSGDLSGMDTWLQGKMP